MDRMHNYPAVSPRLFGFAMLVLTLAACGAAPPPATAALTAPAANAELALDNSTEIIGQVTGADVRAVDIYIDGVRYATVNSPSGPDTYDIVAPWTPTMAGSHVIQLKGVNEQNEVVVSSDLIFVMVVAPEPTPAPPTPTPAPTPSPTPTPAPTTDSTVRATAEVTGTPPTTATVAPTTSAGGAAQLTITNEYANIRTGPGTAYERLGQLNQGQAAPVTGKSEDGLWWQIAYQGGPDGKAWVYGELVQFSGDAAKVPVVKVAPPTAAPATVAPAEPPAATPTLESELPASALLPYSQNMRFTPRDDIGDVPLGYNEPKSSTLTWTVNGAKKLELEIITKAGEGVWSNCPIGDLNSVQAAGFTPGQRTPLTVPSGSFPFTINSRGYYEFIIHVVRADDTITSIPRAVIVDCYKTQ